MSTLEGADDTVIDGFAQAEVVLQGEYSPVFRIALISIAHSLTCPFAHAFGLGSRPPWTKPIEVA